nr:hypothetical protein [Tanacetum cinerariifolium]
IVTKTVQRKASGNVGNTGTRGTMSYGQVTDNKEKLVICYNCRGEGHVSRKCKEKKRVKDSQYFKDKMLLMEAKEKGAVLDAEAKAFLADVECTAPSDQPLAITTTNNFEVSHEDAYDSDVDEGPHAAATFMANLSSTSGTNGATTSHVNEEEHLDSNVESDIDDNTISYHQYQLDSEVQDVPIEVSSVSPGEISMITILDDLRNQLDGNLKVNQEQSMVNDSLRAELARCKLEIQTLERNKVKHDLDTTIVQRNKRNAELEQENVLLKSIISQKVESINSLKTESKKVSSNKKDLKERTKMSNRLGTIKPINYAELNALYSHFVSQKELSREHVYWLPVEELATQKSNPPKPVTPFVHTRPASSKVRTQLLKLIDCFPAFETIIKRRTTPTFHEQWEWHFVHTKKAFSEQVIPFYEHVKELVQSLDENLVTEVTEFMRIFDELDKEYEQRVFKKKKLQIEKKNLLIQNKCLITDCIAKYICSIVLAFDKDRPLSKELSSNCVRENSKVIELEAEILKQQQMLAESDKRCSFIQKNHIDLQIKFRNYKECFKNQTIGDNSHSSVVNAIFEINQLKEQLQGKTTLS